MLLPTLALAASACEPASSSTDGGSNQAAMRSMVAASYAKVESAGSSRVAMTMTMQVQGQSIRIEGTGAISFADRRGRLDLHMQSAALPQAGTISEILDGTVIDMRYPTLTQLVPGARPWLKMDLQKLGKVSGLDISQLGVGTTGNDPSQMLQYLDGASTVSRVGTETVRGVEAIRYHVVIDYRRLAERRPELRESMQRLEQLGVTRAPMDVWIDSSGRVARITIDMPMQSMDASMHMQMDLFDYGVPVHVQAPPANRVSDFLALLQRAQGAQSSSLG